MIQLTGLRALLTVLTILLAGTVSAAGTSASTSASAVTAQRVSDKTTTASVAGEQITSESDFGSSRTKAILSQLAPGVWVHRSWFRFPNGKTYYSNGLVVKSRGSDAADAHTAVLVDTAWGTSSTLNLLAAIEEQLGLTVRAAIVTHWHSDKTAGVDILKSRGIPVYAFAETIELCKKNGEPVPDHPIAGLDKPGTTATVAGLEVMYPGAGHASDNLLVWDAQSQILLGGCAVRSSLDTTPGNLSDADLKAWPASMRRAQAAYGSKARIVIPGHGEPAGPEVLEHTAELAHKFDKLRD